MSVYQCPECGEQGKKYKSVLPSDIEEGFCPSCRSHWDVGLKSDDTTTNTPKSGRCWRSAGGSSPVVLILAGGRGSSCPAG